MFFLTVGKRVSSRFFCTLFAAHDGSAFPPAGFLVFRRFSFFLRQPFSFRCCFLLFPPANFLFLRRFSFPLRQPFSFRCCFLLFPPANFLFLRRFSFSPPAAFLVPLPFFFSLLQAFSFFCGSLFLSAVFLVPQRFSSVFFRVGAFRPPLFRGLKYCKRSDKKKGGRRCMRKPPVKFPWRPESVRVAVVPADPPKSDRSRKCALSTAVTGRRTVKTSCLRESAASGRTGEFDVVAETPVSPAAERAGSTFSAIFATDSGACRRTGTKTPAEAGVPEAAASRRRPAVD